MTYSLQSTIAFIILLFPSITFAVIPSRLPQLPLNETVLRDDLALILDRALLKTEDWDVDFQTSLKNETRFSCTKNRFKLSVGALESEKASTFYKALRELGFYFPHPRFQISPTLSELKRNCGKTFPWRPAVKWRGHHLHTLHPSEWVHGFFMGKEAVALDTVRWLARNGQNVLDVSLLRVPFNDIQTQFKKPFELARALQIQTGVSLGIATQQQKTYKILSVIQSFTGWGADDLITKKIKELFQELPLSFIVLEAGTSEFTPTNYEKTLHWLNLASKEGPVFTKIHVSSNQKSEKWGNYNFLPQFANKEVGVWPHTVMFYGLLDAKAPMYGNENFSGIKDFMLKEKDQRPTWYYPETSYWVGMDVDVPLFLTSYLTTRAADFKFIAENGVEGHANFTTGHALGGWLLDWSLSLFADLDYKFDPLIGLKLLGEDESTWKAHLHFQDEWFKGKGLISMLSGANLQDELLSLHRIHERKTMKELAKDPVAKAAEAKLLRSALHAFPTFDGVRNQELKSLLQVTRFRIEHAALIREGKFDEAANVRTRVVEILTMLEKESLNYPELPLFRPHENPTSYQFGYVYPALKMYFWKREETQLKENSFFPFRNTLYNILHILF